jgi:octaprenyl-diphosphate synthase
MDSEYSAGIKKIEELLERELPSVPGTDWCGRVFPGLDLNPSLAESLLAPGRDLFERGGKRWRPLLSLLVCRTLGGGDSVLPLLPLVEFSHNASLIHDDVEDSSDERRGKAAVHLLYGEDTAVNSGSFLYFLPLAALENWDAAAETKNRVWTLWGRHIRALHLGQSLDIAWHRDPALIPPVDEYLLMCRLKTGCLARFAALLGAEAAAGPDPALYVRLGAGAEQLGVGFQILDDVKNLGAGVPGKKRGDDVVEGKKSLPVLLFLRAGAETQAGTAEGPNFDGERAEFTRRCFKAAREKGINAPEVEEFIHALTEAGVLEEAERRGRELIAQAAAVFTAIPAQNPEAGALLAGFTELLR